MQKKYIQTEKQQNIASCFGLTNTSLKKQSLHHQDMAQRELQEVIGKGHTDNNANNPCAKRTSRKKKQKVRNISSKTN